MNKHKLPEIQEQELKQTGAERLSGLRKPCYHICLSLQQGIVFLNRNENSATFFSYVCNAKKFKALFYPT